ncbi:MAG: RNA polymerase sigma-70 factor (ECF subfamily) [Planctomycetota bacterium]
MENSLTQTLELVRKAQGGDSGALNSLFERYYERLRRCVRVRLGQRLRARMDTQDILQPAFAKAFEMFDRFEMRHEGSLLHWLAEIAERQVHDAVDHASAKKRTAPGGGERSIDDDGGDGSAPHLQVVSAVTGPVDRMNKVEREIAVEECLEEIPEHYRRVIVLRDYDGLEWAEVAKKMDKNTDSAARELHSRALLELGKLLRRRGIGAATP